MTTTATAASTASTSAGLISRGFFRAKHLLTILDWLDVVKHDIAQLLLWKVGDDDWLPVLRQPAYAPVC